MDVESLIRELADRDAGTRGRAAWNLGRLGRAAAPAVAALTAGLNDLEVNVRYFSAVALGRIGDRAAVPALNKAGDEDSEEEVRHAAAKALIVIDRAAIPGAQTESAETGLELRAASDAVPFPPRLADLLAGRDRIDSGAAPGDSAGLRE